MPEEHRLPTEEPTGAETQPPIEVTRPEVKTVAYLGVELPLAENRDSQFVPNPENYADYINDEWALKLQQKIAISWLQGEPILVEGGTSIGKTTTVRKMAAELGYEVHYVNLTGATDVEDLMGRYIPNPNRRSMGDPEYIFADGKVTSGLRQEAGKTKVIILDELNAAAPNILIRLHEVIDALERQGDVILSEDASEAVEVSNATTKVIGLMNPPGKGYFGREPLDPAQLRRWVYQKEVTDLSKETFSHSTDSLFGLTIEAGEVPKEEYLLATDQVLTPEQLKEVPGLAEILAKYKEFHETAKRFVKERQIAADQPQVFSYDDRMEPRRVRNFVLRFYNGDINETFKRALRYYYVNKLENEDDKRKLEEIIPHVDTVTATDARRRGAEREVRADEVVGGEGLEEARTRAEEALSEAMDNPAIPEAVRVRLREGSAAEERGLSGSMVEQLREAELIMSPADVLGPEAIKKSFGIEVRMEAVPPIPFSREELERAKTLGQLLILRVNKSSDGTDLTMNKMNELLLEKFKREGLGKVVYEGSDWYKTEEFFTSETPSLGWALVSKEVIPDSTSKNYLGQTEVLANYIKNQLFLGMPIPSQWQEALDEFWAKKDLIYPLVSSTDELLWKDAAKQLSELKLNRLARQTPTEVLYDLLVRFQTSSERLLENRYTWTKRLSSRGGLVGVGYFDADGAHVSDVRPDRSGGSLGVSFSRSL